MERNTASMSLKIAATVAVCAWSFGLQAQGKKGKKSAPANLQVSAPATGADEGKVDVSDLESKYWAPKDTDFSVVQNRTYSKEKHFFVTPQWGRPINDPYSEGNIYGVTFNYFWSERMGVQATYIDATLKNNESTNDLAGYGSGVQPDHGKFSSHWSLGYNLVPFYAKMSFWGKKIIYFDMAITPTVGMTTYDQMIEGGNKSKSSFTYGIDITQYFFFSRWWAIRADLKNQWHSEEVVKFRSSGGYSKGQKVTDKNIHDTMFLVGFSFFF